jgi:hypothetical protein
MKENEMKENGKKGKEKMSGIQRMRSCPDGKDRTEHK